MENCASKCCQSQMVRVKHKPNHPLQKWQERLQRGAPPVAVLCSTTFIIFTASAVWVFFPNTSAEILEEADLHLCGSVCQAPFPYIWWFAYYCELDQRLGSDGFITDKPLSLLLHLLAEDKADTTGLVLSSEVLKFKQTSKQKKTSKKGIFI